MRIACPECNAAYDVPASQLAPGRPTRCARCEAVWTPVATEDARPPIPAIFTPPRPPPSDPVPPPEASGPAPAAPPAEPAVDNATEPVADRGTDLAADPVADPAQDPAPPPTRRRKGVPALVGWLLTAFLLFVFAFLAVARRDAIVEAWPPAERAYRLVGLSH